LVHQSDYAFGHVTGEFEMLTTLQKAEILAKAGVEVPVFPRSHPMIDGFSESTKQLGFPLSETPSDTPPTREMEAWTRAVEALHVEFVVARAARSLRQATEVELLHRLRTAKAHKPTQCPPR
jgi:hypothetical protein